MRRAEPAGEAAAQLRLDTPLQFLKGVGPARAAELARLGLNKVGDLLRHLPRGYEDRRSIRPLAGLRPGEAQTVRGWVLSVEEQRPRPGLSLLRVAFSDGTGLLEAVWFNQPYLKAQFRPGLAFFLSGRVDFFRGVPQMNSPEFEPAVEGDALHAGRIVPLYPLTGRLTQRWLRQLAWTCVGAAAGEVAEALPPDLLARHHLLEAARAWRAIHFPADQRELEEARRRLAFEELLVLQLGLLLLRGRVRRRASGFRHAPDGELVRRFLAGLPFRLTAAQRRVWGEIAADMESEEPMHRLVQGDVGSGKTVLAVLALLKAVESGYQGALMAPTEILAGQHYLRLRQHLAPLGVRAVLLTGSLDRQERQAALADLAEGRAGVAVGTHALIQEGVAFRALSLAIVDEQHRFGVRQRARLAGKGLDARGRVPDVLVMTATPIPRTLALTLYGDLDVSVVDELPPGRRPVATRLVRGRDRGRVYQFVRRQVEQGRQAYVVCPLVEESDAVAAAAATEWAQRLARALPGLRVGLLHGRLSPDEKEAVMAAFARGEIQILVATTVIEVGIDVPNATVLVVEGAERFGLAQLHQLRGRVGRGGHPSYCFLVAEPAGEEARRRLEVICRHADGFAIAEEDMRLRGPGEIFGTRQHGLPDFLVADPVRDLRLLELARREAEGILAVDPLLSRPEHRGLRGAVAERFRQAAGLLVG